MGMQDWLYIAGGVILLAVIADLIRRYLQRDKLRLKIDKQFQDLPDLDPTCSELPNGGARVVTDPDLPEDWTAPSSDPIDSASLHQVEPTFNAPESDRVEPCFDQVDSEPALDQEPGLVAEPARAESEWKIDPILTGERPTAEPEVDLLMEKEFRGVGEGAHRWLDQAETSSSQSERAEAEPVVEPHFQPDAEPEVVPIAESVSVTEPQQLEEQIVEEASAVEAMLEEPPVAEPRPAEALVEDETAVVNLVEEMLDPTEPSVEPEPQSETKTKQALEQTAADPVPEPLVEETASDAESQQPQEAIEQEKTGQEKTGQEPAKSEPLVAEQSSSQPSLSTVEPALDLERPVHELLQEQQASLKQEPQLGDLDSLVAEPSMPEPEVVEPAPRKPAATRTRKRKRKPRPEEQTSFFDLLPDLAPEPEPEPAKPKPKSRRRRKAKTAEPVVEAPAATEESSAAEDEVLVINVDAREQPFAGPILFKLLNACGMEHGEMAIFHRHEQDKGRGAIQFSTANAVAPGTFDPANSEQFSTPAVTFFMRMSEPADRMNAFECMLATAQCVADNLGGELKDENRSSLRTQTIEHYRQKVREFERKQLTRRV
ncbi:cell division protein ZipA [Motiliproteus coralliicola]|uniref:Cell division protein ZipA n=1 Tax=Motiliproteus coralliicola TaxID=2283196 RepID=A0A369WPE9_9GAMM|nr:cell division protein ZipA [Motiliproteus coralliicola]RDE22446.1 cell division protein ZipA [Motiliproteus coralliicola]